MLMIIYQVLTPLVFLYVIFAMFKKNLTFSSDTSSNEVTNHRRRTRHSTSAL
jgi:hypothetical protein